MAKSLIDILRGKKLISEEALNKALSGRKEKGSSLSETLISQGLIKEEDLISSLAEELHLPWINLSRLEPDPEAVMAIPEETARYYQAVPVSRLGNILSLAISDSLDILTMDDLRFLTGYELRLTLTSRGEIERYLERCYTTVTPEEIQGIAEDIAGVKVEVLNAEKKGEDSAVDLLRLAQDAPVVKLVNRLLLNAVKAKASDVLVEPQEARLQVRYRIDGMLVPVKSPPLSLHPAIISRLKVLAKLDISEHRLPQDGRFKIKIGSNEIDFRFSSVPASSGEKIALRILDKNVATLDIEKLGFDAADVKKMKEVIVQPHGIVLVTGPTGSGKSTTLYSFIKYIDSVEKNIITVEDPVEYELEGINQVAVKEAVGRTFAGALRSILRQDPDIIMIGEIRDYETVDIAIKSALTGHLVLSTLHTTTASGAITRMVNMGVGPFLITASLLMAGSQRLLRKVCPHCKEPQKVSPEMRRRLGIDEGTVLYHGGGCRRCYDTGYRGRIGILEALILNSKIKELILGKASQDEITAEARASGMKTLREDALEKAVQGLTSLDEVLRVT